MSLNFTVNARCDLAEPSVISGIIMVESGSANKRFGFQARDMNSELFEVLLLHEDQVLLRVDKNLDTDKLSTRETALLSILVSSNKPTAEVYQKAQELSTATLTLQRMERYRPGELSSEISTGEVSGKLSTSPKIEKEIRKILRES